MHPSLTHFRRSLIAGVVVSAMLLATWLHSPPAQSQAAVDPGRGSAYAQGVKVDPRTGRLSFGITYGMALAGHQNTVSVAEARSADLGVIGVTLAGEGCDGGEPTLPSEDQPQPLVVRSTDEGAAEGKSESENGVEKTASASDSPLARAVAITAASGDPAILQIGGTVSESTSGIVDGERLATATTEVSSITIAGGAIVIKGLRWTASWTSAPDQDATGSFTIDGIEIAGVAQPVDGDGLQQLAALEPVLEPLGIVIEAPAIREASGIAFVDPMRIGIEPSPTRDGLLGPIFNAVSPVRESVFDALIEADCGNAAYITILDVVLGSVTGAGSLAVELGGVTATSADLGRSSFLGDLPTFSPALPATPSTPIGSAPVSSGGSTSSPTPGPTVTSGGGTTSDTAAPSVASPTTVQQPTDTELASATPGPSGSRGGPLVWISGLGLLLLGALAEGDRRKMRRAQRSVPLEARS